MVSKYSRTVDFWNSNLPSGRLSHSYKQIQHKHSLQATDPRQAPRLSKPMNELSSFFPWQSTCKNSLRNYDRTGLAALRPGLEESNPGISSNAVL
jgi:hypothetical protein